MISMVRLIRRKDIPRRQKIMAAFNIFGILYYIFMIVVTTYLGAFRIVPFLYEADPVNTRIHLLAIFIMVANTAGNFIISMKTDTTIEKLYNKRTTDEKIKQIIENYPEVTFTKKKCRVCGIQVPPRCHHCVLCGICILKRDHHCFFMCTCIGYHNQKYFIMFCFWQWLAGFYGTYIGGLYLTQLYGVKLNSLSNILNFLPEIVQTWKVDMAVSVHQIFITALLLGNFIGALCALGFLFWQIALIFTGSTSHELKNGLPPHSTCQKYTNNAVESSSDRNPPLDNCGNGIWVNFRDIFGPYWFVSVILPIPLPPDGQGLYKQVYKQGDYDMLKRVVLNGKSKEE